MVEPTLQDLKEYTSGERCYFGEDDHPEEIVKDHYERYQFALKKLTGNEVVLDAACGTGYGSIMLAGKAKSVLGLDASQHAIDFAKIKYSKDNLNFGVADFNEKFSLGDAQFDVIVSFETIEHVADQDNMLSELKRILKPGGTLLMSTPDNDLISEGMPSDNPFHIKELKKREFLALLHKYFTIENLYGQVDFIKIALWKRMLKKLRRITPLRKAKQKFLKKTGLEMMVHKSFRAEKYTGIHEVTEEEPSTYYVMIAVCKK